MATATQTILTNRDRQAISHLVSESVRLDNLMWGERDPVRSAELLEQFQEAEHAKWGLAHGLGLDLDEYLSRKSSIPGLSGKVLDRVLETIEQHDQARSIADRYDRVHAMTYHYNSLCWTAEHVLVVTVEEMIDAARAMVVI